MNDDELRVVVRSVLSQIAPEIDAGSFADDADLREELEIDSMDFLTFVTGLHERTGVDVPERDYPELASVDSCVAYLSQRLHS